MRETCTFNFVVRDQLGGEFPLPLVSAPVLVLTRPMVRPPVTDERTSF